ncbi:shikimate dehydrogenase family protein [Rhodobacter maris]|uniref:Shikimate dehydrogenase n=1 Tax=Rhodobacter maris TaxID=446682 RepID=A0A285S6F8_9RHOB|nr:shikimate dehydrogenase [Rhodobacter maris]SOC02696.1 shikimate dehydrogenase [Rhodobacter maris]
MTSSEMPRSLRLGLIGGNITATRSPALHVVCGLSLRCNVTYDLIIPAERGKGFAAVLADCAAQGFDGVNVTYPHKEEAASLVAPGDAVVAAMGAANTVKFTPSGPLAFNTDYAGFKAAYHAAFGAVLPGRVMVLGSGGVGRAVAFGLADLHASELVLVDREPAKVARLAEALRAYAPLLKVVSGHSGVEADLKGFDGVVNCTPLGMVGCPGSALPEGVRGALRWAFDAVYTPIDTRFRAQVEGLGARFLSGYELYFHQGINAFEIFSDLHVSDPGWVREIIQRGS